MNFLVAKKSYFLKYPDDNYEIGFEVFDIQNCPDLGNRVGNRTEVGNRVG